MFRKNNNLCRLLSSGSWGQGGCQIPNGVEVRAPIKNHWGCAESAASGCLYMDHRFKHVPTRSFLKGLSAATETAGWKSSWLTSLSTLVKCSHRVSVDASGVLGSGKRLQAGSKRADELDSPPPRGGVPSAFRKALPLPLMW